MADFTPIQQARRNALGALVNMVKMEHELLALDFAENANEPESVSDVEWTELIKDFARSRLAFVIRDTALLLNDPQQFADMMAKILADTTATIAKMNAGETKHQPSNP